MTITEECLRCGHRIPTQGCDTCGWMVGRCATMREEHDSFAEREHRCMRMDELENERDRTW